jgi:hypothetical protein
MGRSPKRAPLQTFYEAAVAMMRRRPFDSLLPLLAQAAFARRDLMSAFRSKADVAHRLREESWLGSPSAVEGCKIKM